MLRIPVYILGYSIKPVNLFDIEDIESDQIEEDSLFTEISAHTTSDDKTMLFYYILDFVVEGAVVLREPLLEVLNTKQINIDISKNSKYKIVLNYFGRPHQAFLDENAACRVCRICLRGEKAAFKEKTCQ